MFWGLYIYIYKYINDNVFVALIIYSLQKNGSEAVFLKRGHRAKKRSYSPTWPVAAFF